MKYVEISQKCPECGNGLPRRVEALLGFAYCEPDYPVQCGHCRKTVRLELPGPPIDLDTRRAAWPPEVPALADAGTQVGLAHRARRRLRSTRPQ